MAKLLVSPDAKTDLMDISGGLDDGTVAAGNRADKRHKVYLSRKVYCVYFQKLFPIKIIFCVHFY